MNHAASSVLGKSTVILVIVAIAAIALNLAFAHSLHFEPLGLLGFGLFCLGYAGIIPAVTRRTRANNEPVSTLPTHKAVTGPSILTRQPVASKHVFDRGTRPCHALTIDLEDYFHTEVASQGVSFPIGNISLPGLNPARIACSTCWIATIPRQHSLCSAGWLDVIRAWFARSITAAMKSAATASTTNWSAA